MIKENVAIPKVTCKDAISARLYITDGEEWLAVHEFGIVGHSDNSIATRLPEMSKDGVVESRTRKGKAFKEWRLVKMN